MVRFRVDNQGPRSVYDYALGLFQRRLSSMGNYLDACIHCPFTFRGLFMHGKPMRQG